MRFQVPQVPGGGRNPARLHGVERHGPTAPHSRPPPHLPQTHRPERTSRFAQITCPHTADAFPSRELSLSGSSRCSSQPPSTRRVGSGKLQRASTTGVSSGEWCGVQGGARMGSGEEGARAHHLVIAQSSILRNVPRQASASACSAPWATRPAAPLLPRRAAGCAAAAARSSGSGP